MAFNLSLQEKCRRRDDMRERAGETFRTILEPFHLEQLYPKVMKEIGGKWKEVHDILPHQRKLHNRKSLNGSTPRFFMISGGVGTGKTLAMCIEFVRLLRTYPGCKCLCALPYDYYAEDFLMPTWWSVLPEDSPHIKYYNKKSRLLVMTNGSQIRFKAYDDADKIKGFEIHFLWIEEGSEIGDGNNDKATQIWQAFQMRMRANNPPYPSRIYVTQNPKGHNYLWKIFIKSEPTALQPYGDEGLETIWGHTDSGEPMAYYEYEKCTPDGNTLYTIACGTVANKYVAPGYVAAMLGQMADTPELRKRMVEGKFNPINLLVYDYPIFIEKYHCIDYHDFLDVWEIDEIPSWWKVAVGIDCGGQRSPWAVEFYVQTPDGHWVGFDEIYKIRKTWAEIAEEILQRVEGFESVTYWIDPISSNQKSGPTSITIHEEFQAHGIFCQQPKGYNKQGGIGRVQDKLRRDKKVPCPYHDDMQEEDPDGEVQWQIGHSQLYYLTNVPGKHMEGNVHGHACPANIAEKGVYRYDSTKTRMPKAAEEGLSPVQSEKLIDRDDHAQTAEMFVFIGLKPFVKRTRSDRSQRQPLEEREGGMYGRTKKHRSM